MVAKRQMWSREPATETGLPFEWHSRWIMRSARYYTGGDGAARHPYHRAKHITVRNLRRQRRAGVALYTRESCEMHEGTINRSRCGASFNKPNQPTSTQAKGKLRQIKANQCN